MAAGPPMSVLAFVLGVRPPARPPGPPFTCCLVSSTAVVVVVSPASPDDAWRANIASMATAFGV
eukprot:3535321-Pyramimonas_sp.AAC.1